MKETTPNLTTHVETAEIAPDEFLTTGELMKMLKIKHKQTIYNLIQEGLPVVNVGRNYRFIKKEVINFLRQQSKQTS